MTLYHSFTMLICGTSIRLVSIVVSPSAKSNAILLFRPSYIRADKGTGPYKKYCANYVEGGRR
jgi:hypothetical protein